MYKIRVTSARLFIVRHAEAIKNIEKKHGGGTQDLTTSGLKQAEIVAEALCEETANRRSRVYYQEEGRSQYTARIIATAFGQQNAYIAEDISGIGLGVIADLNEEELALKYPCVSRILDGWKTGAVGLRDYPEIPGREHMEGFAMRIRGGLSKIIHPYTDTIIVGTTSTINMLQHLMEHDGEFVRTAYAYMQFPFAGVKGWRLEENRAPERSFSSF